MSNEFTEALVVAVVAALSLGALFVAMLAWCAIENEREK